jgi:hypothetical protein
MGTALGSVVVPYLRARLRQLHQEVAAGGHAVTARRNGDDDSTSSLWDALNQLHVRVKRALAAAYPSLNASLDILQVWPG